MSRSTREARQVVQAAGEVARASASVSARSSSTLAASGTCDSSSVVVAGSSGSRVVARVGEQEVPAHEQGDHLGVEVGEAHPGHDLARHRLAGDRVVVP